MSGSTDLVSTQGRSGMFVARPQPPGIVDRGLAALVYHSFGGAALRFALFDGTELSRPRDPVASVLLRDRATLIRLLLNPGAHFGEDYCEGSIRVDGDLVAAIEAAYAAIEKLRRRVRAPPTRPFSLRASQRNVRCHYDLGDDFYRLWLDRRMVYTCAYFPTAECTLEEAQVAKMDRVCRKLRLRAGERVVEAGSGWGALALHMARHYGVSVRAYNVSPAQVRHAREQASREGLADRVEFVEDDYRHIAGRFDAFVSVGMLEHVGVASYRELGEVIRTCLDAERGRGLLHFIGRNRPEPLNAWINARIFPGAYPPALGQVVQGVLEPAGLSVLDIENLRPHYALTLAHWRARFEGAAETVRRRYGEEFTRAWRLYLAGSEAAFRVGTLQLFQVVLARGERSGIPWTREGT